MERSHTVFRRLVAFFLLAMTVVNSAVRADSWPQWLGPNRNGISSEKNYGSFLCEPQQRWRASVGVAVCSVVVSKGLAFTVGHTRGPGKRGTDAVYCLDADTGVVVWKFVYDCLSCHTQDVRFYGPRSTPTVDGDTVFTLSLEDHLFCFEASTGKVIWSKELPKDLKGRIPVYGYCCSPLVYGDLLILELNAEEASYAALDKSNGTVIRQLAGGNVTCASPVLAEIDGVDCFVLMGGGAVVGVNAGTGMELWRHRTWGHAWTGPAVCGNKIFVANTSLPRGCGTISIDHGRPTIMWEDRKKFQSLHCNSIICKGHIYGTDNTGTDYQGKDSKKSSLKCLELDTGKVKWVEKKMGWANLILFDGKLVILRETGELVIAEAGPEGYEELSRTKVFGGQSWTVPALADGKLYRRDNSGDVVCYQLRGTPKDEVRKEEPAHAKEESANGQWVQATPAQDVTTTIESVLPFTSETQTEWPRFRGPGGWGNAVFTNIPASFDLKTGEGVLWKAAVPLEGQSSPVVWDKRVFLAGANKKKCEVCCFDAHSGQLSWRRAVMAAPANAAPVANDDILFAGQHRSQMAVTFMLSLETAMWPAWILQAQ